MDRNDIMRRLESLRNQTLSHNDAGRKTLQSGEARQGMGAGQEAADSSSYHVMNHLHIDRLESRTRILRQIDMAVQRLAEGSYGCCAHCEQQINSKRLRAIPFAIYCRDCQTILDG